MAVSSSAVISGNINNYLKVKMYVDVISQNTSRNETTLRAKLQVESFSGAVIVSSANKTSTMTVNGTANTVTTTKIGVSANSTTLLQTKDFTIVHDADGGKTVAFSFSQEINATISGVAVTTVTGSGSIELPPIPRASTVLAPNGDIGSNVTITINRASTSFTHTLKYNLGGGLATGTIGTGIGTSKAWTIPITFLDIVKTKKSESCVITCETYDGASLIGSTSDTMTVNVVGQEPVIAISFTDVDTVTPGLTNNALTMVKNYSDMKVTSGVTLGRGATIVENYITINGTVYKGTSASYIATQVDIPGVAVSVSAKDSRGFITTKSLDVTPTLVTYVPLAIKTFTAKRGTGASNTSIIINASGDFFNKTFGTGGVSNVLTFEYSTNGGTSWVVATQGEVSKVGNTFTFIKTLTGFSVDSSYTIKVRVKDLLKTSYTTSNSVNVSRWLPIVEMDSAKAYVHGDLVVDGTGLTTTNSLVVANPVSRPGILIKNASTSEGDIAVPTGDYISMGHFNESTGVYTNQMDVKETGVAVNDDLTIVNGQLVISTPGYFNSGTNEASIQLNNGDIDGVNNIVFNDDCGSSEGLFFPKTGTVHGDTATASYNIFRVDGGGVGYIANGVIHDTRNLIIKSGASTITPVANTPTALAIGFGYTFPSAPTIQVSVNSSVPGTTVTGVAFASVTTTGCTLYVTRTNTTATVVNWVAIWQG